MDKCTFCSGGPEEDGSEAEYVKYGANRLAEGKLPLCAEMCSTKSLLAGDGDIIASIYKERVQKRGYGSGAWVGARLTTRRSRSERRQARGDPMLRAPRLVSVLAILAMLAGVGAPAARAADPMTGANPTAQSVHERDLLNALGKLQGRITLPDGKASLLEQPQGREYRGFHERALPGSAGSSSWRCLLAWRRSTW